MELCKDTDCDVIHTRSPVYRRGKPVWNLATMEVNKKKNSGGGLVDFERKWHHFERFSCKQEIF